MGGSPSGPDIVAPTVPTHVTPHTSDGPPSPTACAVTHGTSSDALPDTSGNHLPTSTDDVSVPVASVSLNLGNYKVPVFAIGENGERVFVESYEADGTEATYFELHSARSSWFRNIFKVRVTETQTYKLLKEKISDTFGRKCRNLWKTSKDGVPVGAPGAITISVDADTELTVLQDRSIVCIAATAASLNWLSKAVTLELSRAKTYTTVPITEDDIDTVSALIKFPFDKDTRDAMHAHGIVWVESKRSLKSSAGVTKVRINLKMRKRFGDAKFTAYVNRRARRAARVAIGLTEGINVIDEPDSADDIAEPDSADDDIAEPGNDDDDMDDV